MAPALEKMLPWTLRAAGSAALALAVAACSRYPFDDAFIHMRVARHLAFDGQPWFNLGERVMGSSSPLWLVLQAGLFRLTGHAERSLVVGIAVASIVFLFLATDAFLRAATRVSAWIAALLAFLLTGTFLTVSTGFLMETGLGLALAVTTLLLLETGWPVLAGVALGLAVATRYEFVLFAALVLALSPARWRVLAGLAPVALVEAGLLWVGFHALVPNTVGAKDVVYRLDWSQFLKTIPARTPDHAIAYLGLLLGTTGLAAIAATRREDREIAALPGLAAALLASYGLRRAFVFDWYWPLVTFPAALGAVTLVLATRGGVRFLASGAALIVAFPLLPQADSAWATVSGALRNEPQATATANLRTVTYARIGSALDAVCPGAVVMAPEIGALGWAFRGPILDAVGLVSPQVLRYHPLSVPDQRSSGFVGAIPTQAVEDLRPDAVVAMSVFATHALRKMQAGEALRDYGMVQALPVFDPSLGPGLPDQLWSSTGTTLLVRKDGPCGRPTALRKALAEAEPSAALARAPGR